MKALIIFLLLASNSFSQADMGVLRGTVVDTDGEVLMFTKVLAFSSGDSSQERIQGAYSDIDGMFRITTLMPGEYDIEFSNYAEGMDTLRLTNVVIRPYQITDLGIVEMTMQTEIIGCDFGYSPPLIPRNEFFGGPTIIRGEEIIRP